MRRAYTLIELLVFLGIFAIVTVGFITVLVAATRVNTEQIAASSVEQESQFLLQKIQYYVEASSLIEASLDTPSSTVKLRMTNPALDPTIITLSGGQVTVQQGTSTAIALTSSRVSISNLNFTKHANPPAHDALAVNFTVKFTGNLLQTFSQAFQGTIARVNAATFDSNLVPSSTAQYNVGITGSIWNSINNLIYFNGTSTGIGIATPNYELEMGNISGGNPIVLQNNNYYAIKDASSTSRSLLTLNSSNNLLLRNAVGRVDINADVAGNVTLAGGGGSVGIGTTAPTDHLTVYGAGDQVTTIQSTDGSGRNVALHLKGAATNADWYIDTNRGDLAGAGDNLFFYKGVGTVGTKMVIQDNGNVGIGTTNPSSALTVVGNVSATNLRPITLINVTSTGSASLSNGSIATLASSPSTAFDGRPTYFSLNTSLYDSAGADEFFKVDFFINFDGGADQFIGRVLGNKAVAHQPGGGVVILTPSSGSHTVNLRWQRIAGTATITQDAGDLIQLTAIEL